MEKNQDGVEKGLFVTKVDRETGTVTMEERILDAAAKAAKQTPSTHAQAVARVQKACDRFEFKGCLKLLSFAWGEPKVWTPYAVTVPLTCMVLDITGKMGLTPLSNSCSISLETLKQKDADSFIELQLLVCVKQLWEHEFKEGVWLDGKYFDHPHSEDLPK